MKSWKSICQTLEKSYQARHQPEISTTAYSVTGSQDAIAGDSFAAFGAVDQRRRSGGRLAVSWLPQSFDNPPVNDMYSKTQRNVMIGYIADPGHFLATPMLALIRNANAWVSGIPAQGAIPNWPQHPGS